jgi:DNA-binding FadR family transcriptional regulator
MSADLLNLAPGTFLGVEDDILARYNVSRPTLRQAARILECQCLLKVKAGAFGGYYVSRPSADELIKTTVAYLQSRGFTFAANVATSLWVDAGMIRSAARSSDEAAREALQVERDLYASLDFTTLTARAFRDAEVRLNAALTRLAGNPALELFSATLYEFGSKAPENQFFEGRGDRISIASSIRIRMIDAILAGDADIAEVINIRRDEAFKKWLAEDLARAPPAPKAGRRKLSRPAAPGRSMAQ